MQMKLTHYIYICTALAMLTACHHDDDDIEIGNEVENLKEEIVLRAGVSEGSAGVQTRAGEDSHVPFSAQTQLRLRVDGTWMGHEPVSVSKMTKAKTAATASDRIDGVVNDKHAVEFTAAEKLYWDDYGTADPNNATTGRTTGLTIYGVAVNGVGTLPSSPTDLNSTDLSWTALQWNVGTPSADVINQKAGWTAYDLVTSNNVRSENTYKFAARASGKLLKFTHAMTKITVNLTAAEGFPAGGSPESPQFQEAPEATLLGFNYIGKVDVEEKTSNAKQADYTDGTAAVANIQMHCEGSSAWQKSHQATLTALVFPGNTFNATIGTDANYTPTSDTNILEFTADGNTYKVTAAQLVKAINAAGTTGSASGTLEQGKNYVLNITVKKTSIDVSATVVNWTDVVAANETPIINVGYCYGHDTGLPGVSAFTQDFSFYRSENKSGSYLEDGNSAVVSYASSAYSMTPSLYWPNHSTHYFFRGIWPKVGSESGEIPIGKVETAAGKTTIAVNNVKYEKETYPSDLMIGMPRKSDGTPDETCKVEAHKTGEVFHEGICATDAPAGSIHANEGLIHMNFQYAMSQVAVELMTSTGPDNVAFDQYTKVEIIDGYTSGALKLADGSSDFTGQSKASYSMHTLALLDYDSYRDAIIPQSLVDGSNNPTLKFRITVGNGGTSDVYETVLGIANIKEQTTGNSITKWEPGKKYVYTLYITKTDIVVVATIKDWVEVKAEDNIWF